MNVDVRITTDLGDQDRATLRRMELALDEIPVIVSKLVRIEDKLDALDAAVAIILGAVNDGPKLAELAATMKQHTAALSAAINAANPTPQPGPGIGQPGTP